MKKQWCLPLMAALIRALLIGCGNAETTPVLVADAGAPVAAPGAVSEPIVSAVPQEAAEPKNTPEPSAQASDLTVLESDFGYSLTYDPGRFDYRRTEGYDEFILNSEEMEKPFVFISIAGIGAEFIEQVRSVALGEDPLPCTIGQAQLAGLCSEFVEDWADGKVCRKTYFCALPTGDALLIETQRYTQQGEDPYATALTQMLDSIA